MYLGVFFELLNIFEGQKVRRVSIGLAVSTFGWPLYFAGQAEEPF